MINSGYLYLAIIYVVWGTTYLAMRVGVGPGSGFPVFAFGAVRCLTAGVILLLFAKLRSQRILPTRRETVYLALTGLGMWTASHGMVLVAEQYIASGFAAVAVATSPLWVLLLSAVLDKKRPDLFHLAFVAVGLLGVAVLMVPQLRDPTGHNVLSLILLVLSPVLWGYCAMSVKRYPQRLSTVTASGYQHVFGGLGFLVLSLLFKEPAPAPVFSAWVALGYLTVFGSIIAFTSYIKALSLLPTHLVLTNTYVNPIIAVFAGWLILGEAITPWTVLAIVLVGVSVAAILRNPNHASGENAKA